MNTKQIVMSRVHTIHTLRPVVSATALSALVLIAAVWGIGEEVWVARILQNMPSIADVQALTRFFVVAFLNTRFIVQVLAVVSFGAFIWLARETTRMLFSAKQFA